MLIIVESPAKARTIKNILGSGYQVEASIGHIRALSDEKKSPSGDKLEINGIDINNRFTPYFVVAEGKNEVVSKLKKLAKNSTDGILFATDSDREGESISWHLSEILGIKDKSKVKRLEFHEITESAIKQALAHPRPLNLDLVEAQKARQVLDKIVGYKLSPVLWAVLSDYKLSAGRVQTPALVLVYKRELEIEAFISEEYWEGYGDFAMPQGQTLGSLKTTKHTPEDEKVAHLPFTLKTLPKKYELINAGTVAGIQNDLTAKPRFTITSVISKSASSRPKPPFTTSTLQQAASSRLGMTPRSTMQAAQKLYEGVDINGKPTALITYMRTDSTFLSAEAISRIRGEMTKHHPEYLHETTRVYSSKSKNAQEAHEAIRPTHPHLTPQSLRGKIEQRLWKLYNLIWSRAMATQAKDEIRELTTYELTNDDSFVFSYTKSVQKVLGYKFFEGVYSKEEKEPQVDLIEGNSYDLSELQLYQKFTQPPGRFSPASLIKELEKQGIGRPSTYASTISTLYDRGYVEADQKSLIPTALGKSVAKIMLDNFQEVTGPEMTAAMEEHLDEISRGELDYEKMLSDFWEPFDREVKTKTEVLKVDREKYKRLSDEKIPDPTGKGMLVLRLGRFGEYWQNEDDPKIMYPKSFREIEQLLKQMNEQYGEKVAGLVSPVSKEPLIIRVSKKTLNPYVATASYTVGSKEKALNIDKLNEIGWTQEVVDKLYTEKPKEGGKGGKRRFFRKKK